MGVGVNVECVVGAGLHTGLAADTTVFIKIHNAIGPEIQRFDRANFDAGRIGAVVTAHHRKHPSGIRELAFFHLFYPSPEHADRHVVLGFAGGGAGVAADAFAVVYDKAVFHANNWLYLFKSDAVKLRNKSSYAGDNHHIYLFSEIIIAFTALLKNH